MAFGYIKAPNTYIVRWRECVTYEMEVDADNEEEAEDAAQRQYSHENEVDSYYEDGSIEILLMKEGEVEEDPDYGYKLAIEEACEDNL